MNYLLREWGATHLFAVPALLLWTFVLCSCESEQHTVQRVETARAHSAWHGQRWEYANRILPGEATLNEMGAEGWELVGTDSQTHDYTFKRPLTANQAAK